MGPRDLKMADLMASAGLPRPEIEERGDSLTVCFQHTDYLLPRHSRNSLIKGQEAILDLLDRFEDGLPLREIIPPFMVPIPVNVK